jgi:hypothetical protein
VGREEIETRKVEPPPLVECEAIGISKSERRALMLKRMVKRIRIIWKTYWIPGLGSIFILALLFLISDCVPGETPTIWKTLGIVISLLLAISTFVVWGQKAAIQTIVELGSSLTSPRGYTKVVNELIGPTVESCRKYHEDYPPTERLNISVTISKPQQAMENIIEGWAWRSFHIKHEWDVRLLHAADGTSRKWSAAEFLPLIIVGSGALVNQVLLPSVTAARGVPYMPFLAGVYADLPDEIQKTVRDLQYLKDVAPTNRASSDNCDPVTLRIKVDHPAIRDLDDKWVQLVPVESTQDMNWDSLRFAFGKLNNRLRDELCSAAFRFYIPDIEASFSSMDRPVTCELHWQYTWPVRIPQAEGQNMSRYQTYIIPFSSLVTIKTLKQTVAIEKATNVTPIFSLPKKPHPHETDPNDGGWIWSWPGHNGSPALPGHSVTLRWEEEPGQQTNSIV